MRGFRTFIAVVEVGRARGDCEGSSRWVNSVV